MKPTDTLRRHSTLQNMRGSKGLSTMNPNTERDERVRQIRERWSVKASNTKSWGERPTLQSIGGMEGAMADIDYLLSRLDSQAAGDDLKSRDDVLAFFGATLKENGDLSINMKKYHAAHLCQEHSFQPWRRSEIEEKCVMCIARDANDAATAMRDRCVKKVRELRDEWLDDPRTRYRSASSFAEWLLPQLESLDT